LVRTSQRVAQVVACTLMLFGGAVGSSNFVVEWSHGKTLAQHSVTLAVGIYGVLGLIGGLGLAFRKRWSVPCAVGWALASTYAAGTSVMAFGDGPLVGVISAYLAAGAICALVVWCARLATRDPSPPVAI
jgi:hypothetical protein